jgi:negative regulator of sigma E activity
MSNTVPAQHPAVVLRSTYQHLRAVLAIAMIAIVGLTVAVVVVATNNAKPISPAAHRTAPATSAPAFAQAGAKLDHRGVNSPATQRENQLNRSYFYPGHY